MSATGPSSVRALSCEIYALEINFTLLRVPEKLVMKYLCSYEEIYFFLHLHDNLVFNV